LREPARGDMIRRHMPTLLIVDDEANIRSSLASALGRDGYQVDGAASPAEARGRLREAYDFVLLDVMFPEGSGLDLLGEIMSAAPETVVIMMSGHATIDDAVKATRLGAFDFLEKPVALERLLVLLRNASRTQALEAETRRLKLAWAQPILGRSQAIQHLLREIERAGTASARVLIQGEHGTGKELVARALHAASPRRDLPFVAVNCAAIPDDLIESELFGHERGAFTGAAQARRGRFEEAHGGTLFLDEVGDLSPRAQTKLLRVLQEGELSRLGGNRTIRVDVRVIAATNRDLAKAVQEERFREDLYFRLAVIPIVVPALRERAEDIPALVEHFAAAVARETGQPPKRFAPGAVTALARHTFPGNVRELRNLVERLSIMTPGAVVAEEDALVVLPATLPDRAPTMSAAVDEFERRQIEEALAAEGGNMTRAAARLGLERSHLYKKMKKLGGKKERHAP
jgi:DNA-binding NtrC family response regulator